MGAAIRLLIADGNPLEREGLKLLAARVVPSAIIDTADSVANAEQLAGAHRYQLAILDMTLPGSHGFSCFLQLQFRLGTAPILLLSGACSEALRDSARALGAAAYLPKSAPLEMVAEAIQGAIGGHMLFPAVPAPANLVVRAGRALQKLSRAQMRVLVALADGRSNKQIAGELGVSEATIKAHLSAAFRKLGVQNRAQALLAMQPLFRDDDTRTA